MPQNPKMHRLRSIWFEFSPSVFVYAKSEKGELQTGWLLTLGHPAGCQILFCSQIVGSFLLPRAGGVGYIVEFMQSGRLFGWPSVGVAAGLVAMFCVWGVKPLNRVDVSHRPDCGSMWLFNFHDLGPRWVYYHCVYAPLNDIFIVKHHYRLDSAGLSCHWL